MIKRFSVTDENNRESIIYMGAPAGVDFQKFNIGILNHAILPGNKMNPSKGLAIFQETVTKSISIVHIQIRSETCRTIRIKSDSPVLVMTFVMHGNPTIQWSSLKPSNFKSGQFNLYGVQLHNQVIHVKPGVTDLLNIQLTFNLLQAELDFKVQMRSFLNLINQEKPAQYLTGPIYGSPKQQYSVRKLFFRLCRQDQYRINCAELVDQFFSASMQDLDVPNPLEFTYAETEEMADVLDTFSQFYSIPNIYKKELTRISMDHLRFDQAVLQACGRTPHEYILSEQMKMAKRMLEESLPVHMVIRGIGYSNKKHKFNRDFLAYYGITLSQFQSSYEGKPW